MERKALLILQIMLRNLDFFPKLVQNDLSVTQWSCVNRYAKGTEQNVPTLCIQVDGAVEIPGEMLVMKPEISVTGMRKLFFQ